MALNQKVLKSLKADYASMTDQTFGFALWCSEHPAALDVEAKKLAKIMTGQNDFQGMQAEWKSYSGLARRANKWLTSTGSQWKIKEVCVHGDGTSIYRIA